MNNFPPYPSCQNPGIKWCWKAGVLGVTVDGKLDVMALEKAVEWKKSYKSKIIWAKLCCLDWIFKIIKITVYKLTQNLCCNQ